MTFPSSIQLIRMSPQIASVCRTAIVLLLFGLCGGNSFGQDIEDTVVRTVQQSLDLVRDTKESARSNQADSDSMREKRIQSIQDRILMIKNLVDRRETSQSTSSANSVGPLPAIQVGAVSNKPPNELRNLDPSLITPSENESPADKKSTTPEIETNSVFPEEMTQPVNTYELGNSLFMAGNVKQALGKYQHFVNENNLQAKKDNWTDCMIANCNRITGNVDTAEHLYRNLTAKKDGSYPAKYAKWHLEYLDKRKSLTSQLDSLNAAIDSLSRSGGSDDGK